MQLLIYSPETSFPDTHGRPHVLFYLQPLPSLLPPFPCHPVAQDSTPELYEFIFIWSCSAPVPMWCQSFMQKLIRITDQLCNSLSWVRPNFLTKIFWIFGYFTSGLPSWSVAHRAAAPDVFAPVTLLPKSWNPCGPLISAVLNIFIH